MHRIYSDHAYHRPEICGRSTFEGRNPRLELIEVVRGGVVVRGTGCNGAAFGGEKKFIVGFDGGLRDCDSFADQARHHIARIAPKLGYDHLSAVIEIPGEDIAAAIFSSENGRDFGHDTIYLAFRDGTGEMQSRTVLRTSTYAVIQHVKILDGCVAVAVSAGGGRRFVVPLSELGRGA